MKIAFFTDGIFLVDLVNSLGAIGYKRGDDYSVIGKEGSFHLIEFKGHATVGHTETSFRCRLSLVLPGAWYQKVRPA